MKTTLELSPPLFEQAKAIAAEHAITFKALVEQGLHMAISALQQNDKPYKYKDLSVGSVRGGGLSAEFANESWHEQLESMYAASK
jgi:hypothetical protein